MFRPGIVAILSGLLTFLLGLAASAAPPLGDTLLPRATKLFVNVGNVPELIEHWNKTDLGRLLDDPAMKAFGEDLRRQFKAKGLELRERIGLTIEDLDGLATGELSIAVIPTPAGKPGMVVLIDVSNNLAKAQESIAKVGAFYQTKNATRSGQSVGGTSLTVFDIPPAGDKPARQSALFLHQDCLALTDNAAVAADVLHRLLNQGQAGLNESAAYQSVQRRAAEGNTLSVDVRWFVDPFGLADAMRASQPRQHGGRDSLKLAHKEGFDAIQAIGGLVSLSAGSLGTVSRTVVHAPPPYRNSMRMLVLPNGGDFSPQPWVPQDVATYTSFQVEIQNAFDNFGTLFDALFGEGEDGVWNDTLDSIVSDPNGPQLDLKKDLVAHLGKRVTMLTDNMEPATPNSQRRLLAIEATNEQALAISVEKSMKNDKQVIKRQFQNYTIYEILPEEDAVPEVRVEGAPLPAVADKAAAGKPAAPRPARGRLAGVEGESGRLLSNSAVTVAHGYLFISTHLELLEKVLGQPAVFQALASNRGYLDVAKQFAPLGAAKSSMQGYSSLADKWFLSYEMFRQGRLPEADLPLAQLLNAIFDDAPEGGVRKTRLDGSKLPSFDVARKYLGIGGTFAMSQPDGWLLVDFTLHRAPLRPAEARVPAQVK